MWFAVDDHGEVGVEVLVVGLVDGRFGFGGGFLPLQVFFRGWDVISSGSLHPRCFEGSESVEGWRRKR